MMDKILRKEFRARDNGSSAQAMIEYIVLAGMLVACVAIFAVFLVAFKESGGRVLDLVAADYP